MYKSSKQYVILFLHILQFKLSTQSDRVCSITDNTSWYTQLMSHQSNAINSKYYQQKENHLKLIVEMFRVIYIHQDINESKNYIPPQINMCRKQMHKIHNWLSGTDPELLYSEGKMYLYIIFRI